MKPMAIVSCSISASPRCCGTSEGVSVSARRVSLDKDDLPLWKGGLYISAIPDADLDRFPAEPPRPLDGLSLFPAKIQGRFG
jgi:hypothetical protein